MISNLIIDEEEQSLQQELSSLKIKLESTITPQGREEFNQKINAIEQQLKSLQAKKEQTSTHSSNLKQQKPDNKVTLRGYNAELDEELISIKNPINGSSVRIPIQADNEKTGMIANSLFLRQILQPTEAEKLIFPEERFTPNDLPTFTMLPFSNEILATLHLGHSGNILTLFELKTLQKQFKRLQTPKNPTYLKSPADEIKEDFKALGLLDNSMLIKHKFLSLLNNLHSQPNLKLF